MGAFDFPRVARDTDTVKVPEGFVAHLTDAICDQPARMDKVELRGW